MNLSLACSSCGTRLKVPENAAGRKTKCPKCGTALLVPASLSGDAGASPASVLHADAKLPEQEAAHASNEDRHSPGPPPLPPPEHENVAAREPEDPATLGVIRFEGVMTPRIGLLDRERVLDTFDASFWDLGLIGWLLHYKDRIVVTSHRVMRFRKRIISNDLSIIWLAQITFARVGQSLNWKKLVIGAFLCFNFCPLCSWLSLPGLLASLPLDVAGRIGLLMVLVLQGIVFLIGAYLVLISREKVMVVSTGEDKVRIDLMRMKPEEGRRFVDSVFRALNARHVGYGKPTEPSSTTWVPA